MYCARCSEGKDNAFNDCQLFFSVQMRMRSMPEWKFTITRRLLSSLLALGNNNDFFLFLEYFIEHGVWLKHTMNFIQQETVYHHGNGPFIGFVNSNILLFPTKIPTFFPIPKFQLSTKSVNYDSLDLSWESKQSPCLSLWLQNESMTFPMKRPGLEQKNKNSPIRIIRAKV